MKAVKTVTILDTLAHLSQKSWGYLHTIWKHYITLYIGSYLLSTSCPVPIIQKMILVCKWTASNDRQCTYQLHSHLEDLKEETMKAWSTYIIMMHQVLLLLSIETIDSFTKINNSN